MVPQDALGHRSTKGLDGFTVLYEGSRQLLVPRFGPLLASGVDPVVLLSVRKGRAAMGDLLCGLKLTHDGGVAVIDGDRLLFSVEAEKLENRARYSRLNRSGDIGRILADNDVRVRDLAGVAVDGWSRWQTGSALVAVVDDEGNGTPLDLADYLDAPGTVDLHDRPTATAPLFGAAPTTYRSYSHATDHALASYCTSPYAREHRPALILVWDGGMVPMLYRIDPAARSLVSLAPLMPVSGGLYPIFATHLSPFRTRDGGGPTGYALDAMLLPVSGKAMAYTALGEPVEEAIAAMRALTAEIRPIDVVRSYQWSRVLLRRLADLRLTDGAMLASFQEYLCRLLLESLAAFLDKHPEARDLPGCLSGGCALNIKWNSRVRSSGLLAGVWVPPFPNDAGSAIGAACAEMIRHTGRYALDWSVFAGPRLLPTDQPPDGWAASPCPVEDLARLLDVEGEPVVVLAGRAETGPRALGHRSIIAPATTAAMRDRLNEVKGREWYRPVAPICLEAMAPEVFSPGVHDPYMLYDHGIRPAWRDRVPAIVHRDGSARLQTVGPDNPLMFQLLTEYHRRTGIPVLCNTSANVNGCGFFPDAASAMRWGNVRYVWSEGTLYQAVASGLRDIPVPAVTAGSGQSS
jgi:carbamoyltransferase